MFPNQDAVNRHLMWTDPVMKFIDVSPAPRRIVGVAADIDDELRFHLEHQVALHVERGMDRAEAERRAKMLLERMHEPVLSPERIRALEGIELLEGLRTAEARQVLQRVADGVPEARLTQEARAVLQRLVARTARR